MQISKETQTNKMTKFYSIKTTLLFYRPNKGMMKTYKKVIKYHQDIEKILVGEGSLTIKHVPHETRYFGENKTSLGLVFTTKASSLQKIKNATIEIKAEKWISNESFKRPQFYNGVLVNHELISHEIRVAALSKIIIMKDICANVALGAFSNKNVIQLFEKNGVSLIDVEGNKFDNKTIFLDRLMQPEAFNLLNSKSKFVIDSINMLRCDAKENEISEILACLTDINNLSLMQYLDLTSSNEAGQEGLIKKMFNYNL